MMNFLLHNRIEISNGKEKIFFYNKMLKSVFEKLKEFKSYNQYITLGTGCDSDFSENNFKLKSPLKSYLLETEYLQNDITGTEIYIKKTAVIDDSFLDGKLLTEAGLSDGKEYNPTIFNYFQLSIDDNVVGIEKQKGIPLVISVYIFLDISKSSDSSGMLTAGKNRFLDFLLGEGLSDNIYLARGKTLTDNSNYINRESFDNSEAVLCDVNSQISSNILTIDFVANLGKGNVYEAVMLIGNQPFARVFTLNKDEIFEENKIFSAKTNLTFEIGENISEIIQVENVENGTLEENFYLNKYANSFGDKIYLPFNNIFDYNTSRFLSKDGKMLFFVLENRIYGYKNEKHSLTEIDTGIVNIQNIMKVISFENYVFVISKSEPYLSAYVIENNRLESCAVDFSLFDEIDILSNILNCDITISKDNIFMLGLIEESTKYGYTIYFGFDSENKNFYYDSYLCSEIKFNYILSMFKNNYNDAMVIFLKADDNSYDCKIVYHYSDKTYKDLYSALSWYLTYDTKEIYVKNRAIVLEKVSSPNISLYLYPDIIENELILSELNQESYISTNLNYLILDLGNSDLKILNLIDYNLTSEFIGGFPMDLDKSKILDIEFLDDVILFFMNDEKEKIKGYNLFDNKSYISNVSSNESTYNVSMKKYRIIGENSEVSGNFKIKVLV